MESPKAHPSRLIALLVVVVCAGVAISSVVRGAGPLVSAVVAASIALFTFSKLPGASEMERREHQRRLEQFRESARAIGNAPDALTVLEERRTTLGLSEDDVAAELKAIRQWQAQKRRFVFVSTFAREFPAATPEKLDELARAGSERELATKVRDHLQAIEAAQAILHLKQKTASREELPVIPDAAGIAGGDTPHFAAKVLFDKRGPNDERGTLMLTDRRVLFQGTKLSSVAWTKVSSVTRDGLNLLVQREDRQTPWIFCFDGLKDVTAAEFFGRFLIGQRDYRFVAPASLLAIPQMADAPDLPAAIHAHAGSDVLKATTGLTLAGLMLAMGFAETPARETIPAGTSAAVPSAATAQPQRLPQPEVVAAPPNMAVVVVSPDVASRDDELWRIARQLHPPNLPPTEIMFWVDKQAAPTKLPLTPAQISQRVAVISVGRGAGDRLVRGKPAQPALER
jgi:hypothetical protein